jgi:hypothetical protein
MSRERRLRRPLIYEAVRSLPTEICGMISDYAARQPYIWNDDIFRPAATCSSVDESTTTFTNNDDQLMVVPWRSFRSSTPVTNSHYEWTVELDYSNGCIGWSGAGVSTTSDNGVQKNLTTVLGIAGADDWTLSVGFRPLDMRLVHNGKIISDAILRSMTGRIYDLQIWFRADPSTGTIQARWRGGGLLPPKRRIVWKAYPIPMDPATLMAAIRPAVVLSGPTTAVFRSGPPADAAGFPADWTDLVVATG